MNLSKVTQLESGKAVQSLSGEYSAMFREHLIYPRVKSVRKASQIIWD